jgi:hypothetical protein
MRAVVLGALLGRVEQLLDKDRVAPFAVYRCLAQHPNFTKAMGSAQGTAGRIVYENPASELPEATALTCACHNPFAQRRVPDARAVRRSIRVDREFRDAGEAWPLTVLAAARPTDHGVSRSTTTEG